jgi:hypothetical protein
MKQLEKSRLSLISDNIANAYIEYITYNKTAEGGVQLNLRDTSRILSELYNSALILKTLQLIDDFVKDNIRQLDLNETNADGTSKPKLETDIINTIKNRFKMYFKMNDDLSSRVRNVVEPARRSSNMELQTYLKELVKPTVEEMSDQYALIDIYNKYIANIKKVIKDEYVKKYMYVGVSTIAGDSKDALSGEVPEIYVYLNVVSKEEYEKNPNRSCVMSDDRIANNLRQVLYSNTMLNGSFPEVNPYRAFAFLKGSEAITKTDMVRNSNTLLENVVSPPEKSASTSPVPPPPNMGQIAKTGGKRRKSRKYRAHANRRTRK